MIKTPVLFDAGIYKDVKPASPRLPSRQQLQRLSTGDSVQLNAQGEYFGCRIVFHTGKVLIGCITGHLQRTHLHFLEKDDLIAFNTTSVYSVTPGLHEQLPADWMICLWPGAGENGQCLLRTKWPSLLASAEVLGNGFVHMQVLRLYDEPENPATDIPKLLEGGRRWFTENYLKK